MVYSAGLFLHFLVVGIAFGAAALIHSSQERLRSAPRVADARAALLQLGAAARAMPLIGLGLFATGAVLTQSRWSWTIPWIDVSIAGLVAMQVISGAILRPGMVRIGRALDEAGTSDVSGALAATIRDRRVFVVSHVPPALAIGIMYVMVTKPGAIAGVAVLLVAVVAGAILATLTGRAG